jgi:NADH dehydrogenase [ubiquinone] 1 alpha subcomplex assembly factor 7
MTPLAGIVRQQIRATGPITLAEYMTLCLAHPEHGYYRSRDPLGERGDFTTAPEVSQMFGELVGLWLASQWQGGPFVLAEIGPGRGTLMADILRATARVEGFHQSARICLVETSPVLMARQQDALAGHSVEWFESISELPEGPLLLVANEFFDVLPIRQFARTAKGWQERMIGLEGDMLGFGLAPPVPLDLPEHPAGTIIETCPAGAAIASDLGARISRDGGALLFIDYGAWDGSGDTFQALERHGYADPFVNPGEADLTAHVRFKPLADASGLIPAFTTQGEFLARLGIGARAEALARTGNPDRIAADLGRLTDPSEMGELFKVMALVPEGTGPLPGFAK